MPAIRQPISVSQLAELLGVDPQRFISIEPEPCRKTDVPRDPSRWWIVLEPEAEMAQTTGTFPELTKRKPKGKGKRGC
jgi:hypothetical protein